MTAKIIAIINQKGGCGKTTITMNLAGTFALRHNKKVLIIDGDKQSSATRWANNAPENSEFPCTVVSLASTGKDAHRSLKKFINDYEYIFVDCPPNIESEFNGSVLLVSTLAVVPIIPSSLDLWAMEGTFKLISSVKAVKQDLISKILLNCCEPNKKLSNEISMHIKSLDDIDVLDTTIKSRTIYGIVPLEGQTVYSSKNSEAINEMSLLADEVIGLVE